MQKSCHQYRFWVIFLYLFFLCNISAYAQLTLVVAAIPANTPPGASIHAVGNFNNWNPGDPNTVLTPDGGVYTLTLNPPPGQVQFKFTRGSWATVEGNANGGFLPNRSVQYNGQPTTLTLSILSWEDLGGVNSTAQPNVQILYNNFYIPQLNRNRRIWLYLPPDYHTTNKPYPVLYMHDGQNLFDAATSFSGEWEVDEALNSLHAQGDYGCIVVGIDNGDVHRLDEYSPWVNPQYGGGQGLQYLEFIVATLKPHIDSLYRTLPGPQYTGVMGSSMGGLISMYALAERQDVFRKAGIFSPAFWFAGTNPANHVLDKGKQADVRVYFLAGGQEPASVATNMNAVADAMLQTGFGAQEQLRLVPADGQHAEWFWRREFPAAYQWLFQNTVSAHALAPDDCEAYIAPNPVADRLRIGCARSLGDLLDVQLFGSDGRLLRDLQVRSGDTLGVADLAPGIYLARMRRPDGLWHAIRFVR